MANTNSFNYSPQLRFNANDGQMINRYKELLAQKESQYLKASQQMRKKLNQAKKLRSCLSKINNANQDVVVQ
jgi:hypothetical protein